MERFKYELEKWGRKWWVCNVAGFRCTGAGSRPELAIRNWHEQKRLWDNADAVAMFPVQRNTLDYSRPV